MFRASLCWQGGNTRPSPAPGLPGRLRRHGDREGTQSRSRQGVMEASSGLGGGEAQTFTRSHPPASYIHSQSAPCSENQTHSSHCLRKSLTVIPLPQKITHRHPPASHCHTAVTPTLGRLPWCCVCVLDILLFYLHTLTHGHAPASQVTHSHPPASHSYEFGGGGLFLDPRDSALGFMSLRAPGRDPPRPVIPGAELRQGDD